MRRLVGSIRNYAWGSRTALAALQGRPVPSVQPEAELWLGAHPSAPSLVDGVPLTQVVAADPASVLGQPVVDRFGPRLPYLLKVLAAAEPLSLQAHPDADQARAGFLADQARPDGATRRYVDPYHKPEVLVALDSFDALCGFRAPARSAEILADFSVPALDRVVAALRAPDESAALRRAVELVMRWPAPERAALVGAVAEAGRLRADSEEPAFDLAARLAELYPGDIGVVLALLLNRVRLATDEAVFMPAGNLHAYLSGVGVEIMAGSDNVLRGGLTPKYVDVAELLRVLRYEPLVDPVLRPVQLCPGVVGWPVPVAEFALVKAVAPAGSGLVAVPGSGPRIVVCVAGAALCGDAAVRLGPGEAAFVAAGEPAVTVRCGSEVDAIVFQAAVGG